MSEKTWFETGPFDASMRSYEKRPATVTVPYMLILKAEAVIRFSAHKKGVVHARLAEELANELRAALESVTKTSPSTPDDPMSNAPNQDT